MRGNQDRIKTRLESVAFLNIILVLNIFLAEIIHKIKPYDCFKTKCWHSAFNRLSPFQKSIKNHDVTSPLRT